MRKTPLLLFAGLIVSGLIFVIYLGRTVAGDLDALSTARHDDINWTISQLEIETLNLEGAARDALRSQNDDLSSFRRRFDIYFSRVQTLTQSKFYGPINNDPAAQQGLTATSAFLNATTPIVDGPDTELRAALPDILRQIAELRPLARTLTLAGVQVFAQEDANRRAELSRTLVKLALCAFGLIIVLVGALATLLKLHRKGQLAAAGNHVLRSRYEAAISSSLDAVLVVDTEGIIIEFNGAAEAVFGYSRDEALGAEMATLIVPERLRKMHRAGMARFLETGEQKVIGAGRVRLEGLRKSGEVFPVEVSISLSEANGERVFVSYLRDITRELEAEEELRSARDKAQEGEKAKSDLLTVMSHEMRTPLNGILGSLALLDPEKFDARQRQHLNSIAVSGELLLSHVNDVLDLSSLGSETTPREKVNFSLRDLLQQVTGSLMATAQERGNTLKVTCLSDDLDFVNGAKRSVQQCLINLVGNAIKFCRDGEVAIEVERLSARDLVEIRVSDTGVGIASENLDRIFEEFVTIDTAYSRQSAGTGLGLAITKRLVEVMEGEVEAESVLGEGSLLTLRIPLPAAPAGRADQLEALESRPEIKFSGLHTLVVDDNEVNRMVLGEMLRKIGFSVEEAADGYQALDRISTERFDIIFLDISMPDIDGLETLQRIRQMDVEWRDVPAIAVTAHAARKDHDAIRKAPFVDLMVKPVRPEDIQASLSHALSATHQRWDENDCVAAKEDFITQFGKSKYQEAVQGFRSELTEFITELEMVSPLTEEARQEAHRLCGSSAVLGEGEVQAHLQAIENCDEDDWLVFQTRVIRDLEMLSDPDT